ncbi:unnamed protein product, partial [Amoebophrya sp. A25]
RKARSSYYHRAMPCYRRNYTGSRESFTGTGTHRRPRSDRSFSPESRPGCSEYMVDVV